MSTTLGTEIVARPQAGAGSSDPAPVGNSPRKFEMAVRELRTVCAAHGLDQVTLMALLQNEKLAPAVGYMFNFNVGDTIPTRRAMRHLVEAVEDKLDLQEPIKHGLASFPAKAGSAVRAIFAGAVLAFSTWTVVGSILDRTNAMSRENSPAFTLTVLTVALVCLALLEAAHIGAVALSTADVSELGAKYPRVHGMHKHIATPALLEEYLAARQVGVVMIVFVIAEVTRTVGLDHLPGTTVHLPAFTESLFQVGVPGALMVLVIGQVAPQLITARRPARMMNTMPMAAAFHITRAIGMLGLAKPAGWLVSFSKATEIIPSARRKRYIDVTRDVQGVGVQTVFRTVNVSATSASSTTDSTVLVYEDGRTSIEDRAASVPVSAAGVQPRVSIQRGDSFEAVELTGSLDGEDSEAGDYAHSVFALTAAPALGVFKADDIVRFSTHAVLSRSITSDSLIISEPTKLAMMRVILEQPPRPLPPAKMVVVRASDQTVLDEADVMPVRMADGSAAFTLTVSYPDPGTVILLDWGKETFTS